MTISLSDDVFKGVIPRGYDDPWQQQQDQMQRALQQLAPLTPDGGRQVLWRCPQCQKPWLEATTTSVQINLSAEQLTGYAFQLGINDLERLPALPCPPCSRQALGGMLRIEEGIGGKACYRFVFRSLEREEVQIFHLLMLDAQMLSLVRSRGDWSAPHEQMVCWPTDLLLDKPFLRIILHLLVGLPEPEIAQIAPFDAAALDREARGFSLPLADPCFLRGYFWRPAQERQPGMPEHELLLAFTMTSPHLVACDPLSLWAFWRCLFERYERLL
jgi:hypothetical protein